MTSLPGKNEKSNLAVDDDITFFLPGNVILYFKSFEKKTRNFLTGYGSRRTDDDIYRSTALDNLDPLPAHMRYCAGSVQDPTHETCPNVDHAGYMDGPHPAT